MKNSRLYQLFEQLNAEHLRELRKWVRSPYYNPRKDVVQLFDFLSRNKKEQKPAPSKESAFQAVYGEEIYKDGQLRLIMTFLLKNIEQYLVQKSLWKETAAQTELAKIYRKMNLPRHFEHQIKKLEKTQVSSNLSNAQFYEENANIAWEKYQFAAQYRQQREFHLQELNTQSDITYFARKLQQACFILAHQAVSQVEYQLPLLPEILDFIARENWLRYPAVSIYYHCYQALQQPPESGWFERYRKELETYRGRFPEEEIQSLHLLALNFCIRQYNAGNTAYLQEEFELYRESLEAGYLYTEGYLSRFTYRNVLTVCLAVGDLVWAAQFIEQYIEKLEQQYRESEYSLNKARLEYRQKNYRNALLLLQKSEFTEFFANVMAKVVMIKIFFETDEYDVLEAQLASLKSFLYRRKDIGAHRENYLNFIRLVGKLIAILPNDKVAKKALKMEVEQMERVAERAWLLEWIG